VLKRSLVQLLLCTGMARVNEGSHSFTCHPHVYPQVEWTIPAFTPQLQSITAFWLVYSFPVRSTWQGAVTVLFGWVGNRRSGFLFGVSKSICPAKKSSDEVALCQMLW